VGEQFGELLVEDAELVATGVAHAQIRTTADIYAHVRLRLQRRAIEAMDYGLQSTSNSDHTDDTEYTNDSPDDPTESDDD
jgi:hypothetical protein